MRLLVSRAEPQLAKWCCRPGEDVVYLTSRGNSYCPSQLSADGSVVGNASRSITEVRGSSGSPKALMQVWKRAPLTLTLPLYRFMSATLVKFRSAPQACAVCSGCTAALVYGCHCLLFSSSS